MRIFHVSDTHIGYSAFARIDSDTGINQREVDFYTSFERFVEIALKEHPGLIIHSGDLFDTVRPSNRAISFALQQIKKLSDAGIPFVAISGNHETPRLKETGSVFRILEHLPNCSFVYENGFKRIVSDGVEIMCHPHASDEEFRQGMAAASEVEKEHPRIVMLHVGVVGLGVFRTDEINELILKPSDMDPKADYIALGHYHEFTEISKNTAYAGSTERLSISEANSEKGFIDLDLDSGNKRFVMLPTRPMIDIPALKLEGENASEVRDRILDELEGREIDDAIIRMTVRGISRDAHRSLDLNRIRKYAQKALNFELRIERDEKEQVIGGATSHIGSLEEEFRRYLEQRCPEPEERKKLNLIAMDFFEEREQ